MYGVWQRPDQGSVARDGSRSVVYALLVGAMAGGLATVPMTVLMKSWRRRLPLHQRYALPPRQIAMETLDRLKLRRTLDVRRRKWFVNAAHYGYGAAAGAGFAALTMSASHRRLQTPQARLSGGICYGITVWAGSYFGLLPAIGFRASGTRAPQARNTMMAAAHVVWGFTLGALTLAVPKVIRADAPAVAR